MSGNLFLMKQIYSSAVHFLPLMWKIEAKRLCNATQKTPLTPLPLTNVYRVVKLQFADHVCPIVRPFMWRMRGGPAGLKKYLPEFPARGDEGVNARPAVK